jgi:hypothetical protein
VFSSKTVILEAMTVRKAHCDWGREVCGELSVAERREWLCVNGIGGYAAGTVAGLHTRRYHGLLVAALDPPRARTLMVAKLEDRVRYDGAVHTLSTNRWADGTIAPDGFRRIERFRLDGTTPVWTYAVAHALVEKRVWMEHGANTTYVSYRLVRSSAPVALEMDVLVTYRDHNALTRAGDWMMTVDRLKDGLRVTAFDGERQDRQSLLDRRAGDQPDEQQRLRDREGRHHRVHAQAGVRARPSRDHGERDRAESHAESALATAVGRDVARAERARDPARPAPAHRRASRSGEGDLFPRVK